MPTRRASRFSRLGAPGLGLALSALGACVTDPGEFLQVALAVSDSLVTPSQPLNVEVFVSNYGGREVAIVVECSPHFRVSGVGGLIVGPEPITCPPDAASLMTLPAGTSTTFQTLWAGTDTSGAQLPFGPYGLEAWATPQGRDPIYTGVLIVLFDEDTVPTDTTSTP